MRRGASVTRAGDLDRLVRIEQDANLGQKDANGDALAPNWTTFAAVWAQKLPVRGMEARQALREVGERYETFFVYYISPLPTEVMRLVDTTTDEIFDIRSVSDVEGARRLLELTCRIVR